MLQYKDLLQLLLDATLDEKEENAEDLKKDGSLKLSDDEVVLVCIDFLLAGYETTASTLAFMSYLLALNPEVQEKLQAEIQDYYQDNPVRRYRFDITHQGCIRSGGTLEFPPWENSPPPPSQVLLYVRDCDNFMYNEEYKGGIN